MSDDTITVTLSVPVAGPDGNVTELKLRPATGGDIAQCGNPVWLSADADGTGKIHYDARAMSAMIATLSGHIPAVIGRLHARDWNTAAYALSGQFLPNWEHLNG